MKTLALLLFPICLAACAGAKPTPAPSRPVDVNSGAGQYLDFLATGAFESAAGMFAPDMRKQVSPDAVRESWMRVLAEHGAFKAKGEARVEKADAYDVVLLRTEFERSPLVLKVVFNASREIVGFFYLPVGPAPVTAPAEKDPTSAAKAFVDELAAGKFAVATARFDDTMRKAVPSERLVELWQSLVDKNGAFKSQLDTRAQGHGAYEIILVGCQFERDALDLKVVFNRADLKIAGLFIVPRYAPSPSASTDAFTATEVVVGSDPWRLPGTLTMPKGAGPFPALVLVHGSGPNDRDETIGPNKPFRDLAEGLATRGVAVLRYDKRTLVHNGRLDEIQKPTVKDEAIDDAVAAVALLKATPGIDPKRVFVLGHSLGGELAPRIAVAEPKIAGLVILAGATRPTEDVIIEQVRYIASLDGTLSDSEKARIEQLEREREQVRRLTAESTESIRGIPASYWLDLRGYDAPAAAKKLKQPMLVLQGERDYQVTMADFANWKRALGSQKRVTFRTYPKLNHLFLPGEGAKSTPAEYDVPGHVPAEVLDDIASWVKAR